MPKKKVKAEKKVAGKKAQSASPARKIARVLTAVIVVAIAALCAVGDWYVHHPSEWLAERQSFLTAPLVYFGDRTALLTDAFGWTGHDAVYDSDDPIPSGQVFFAGQPQRVGAPAQSRARSSLVRTTRRSRGARANNSSRRRSVGARISP